VALAKAGESGVTVVRVSDVLRDVSDRLVHADIRRDRRASHVHARFIGARILLAGLGVAAVLATLLWDGDIGGFRMALAAAVFTLLGPAILLSRTGDMDRAASLSGVMQAALIAALAVASGGLESPALALFALVLLDVGLSGSRLAWRLSIGAVIGGFVLAALWPAPASDAMSVSTGPIVTLALVCYGAVMAWIVLARDARNQTSHIRAQARATAALNAVTDVVLWCERDGAISFANAAAWRTLGVDRRELSDRLLTERVNVGDRPAFLTALSEARGPRGGGEARVRVAVGEGEDAAVRLFDLSARRAADGRGHEAGEPVVLVLRDVTEQAAADAMREAARREAERMASSKSQFLATMSHELRTPLNAVIGFSDLLLQKAVVPDGDPRRDEYARIINSSGQHLLDVVNGILDMSKIESGMMAVEQEPVDVAAILRACLEVVTVKAADRGVKLVEASTPGLPEIIADRRALKQVLLNLVSNAVKFTPAGGEVTVTGVVDRDVVEIAVTDTGIGIAADDMAQLGSPFFQVRQAYDRQHEGTGLGLSVVRGLVGLLGGSLAIESAPGEGTRVSIRLPIRGAGAGASREPAPIVTRLRPSRVRLEPAAPAARADDAADGAGLRKTA
jgi:cell cycle sensor histidine kinase DivJ